MKNNLTFSVIIPSFNEGDDIRLSIESVLKQTLPAKEVVVVDDSADDTPDIIGEYAERGVRLIRGQKTGCCGARNLGMKNATGDIVALLNADVKPPPEFLKKINAHYQNGADYVLAESRVINQENFWARFVEMQHRYDSKKIGERAQWTEGFSCRREAAMKVGLIPGDFPVRFCRDWLMGQKLHEAGYKKVIDLSIVIPHKAPDNFKEFWYVRVARGRFGALFQYYLSKSSPAILFIKFTIKHALLLLKTITLLPFIYKPFKMSIYSKKILDLPRFVYVYLIQEYARAVGEWRGWQMIKNKPNNE